MLPHRHFLVALSILRVWPMGHLYVSVNICQVFSRAAADHKSGMACRVLNELSPCKPCKLSPCHVQYVRVMSSMSSSLARPKMRKLKSWALPV